MKSEAFLLPLGSVHPERIDLIAILGILNFYFLLHNWHGESCNTKVDSVFIILYRKRSNSIDIAQKSGCITNEESTSHLLNSYFVVIRFFRNKFKSLPSV